MERYRVLSHTADTGIEASAATLNQLIERLAFGMFDLMFDLDSLEPVEWLTASIEASTVDDLVVDVLSELLYLSEVNDFAACAIVVETDGHTNARVRAGGIPVREAELQGPPIKAVTYHQLAISQSDDGWHGRVIFDV